MLREENIAIEIKSQGYECKTYIANVEGTEAVLLFESQQRTADMRCPVCGSTVHIYDSGSMNSRVKAQRKHSGVRYVGTQSMYMTAGA